MKKYLKSFYQGIILFLCITSTHQKLFGKTDVFFSPGNSTTATLIKYINDTKKKIRAAIYMFTDKNIANALIKAHKERGVDVELVIDKISIESQYGKGMYLRQNGISLHIFDSNSDKTTRTTSTKWQQFEPIMHNKFALLDDKVWTGSFNWTRAANQQNEENVIVTDNQGVYKKYAERYEHLKGRCFGWQQPRIKTQVKAQAQKQPNQQKISNVIKKANKRRRRVNKI